MSAYQELLSTAREAMGKLAAPDARLDVAPALTCVEADAVAALIELTHSRGTAEAFLRAHAHADEEGDEHYQLKLDAERPSPTNDPEPWRCVDWSWCTNHEPLGGPCRSAERSRHNCQFDPRPEYDTPESEEKNR